MSKKDESQKALEEVAATSAPAVVPQQQGMVQKPGMESANFDQSDFIIPRAKIVQAMSREATENDVRPGSMVNTATGEVLASPGEVFRVQVVIVSTGQVYLEDNGLKCYSPDRITGIGDPGGSCVTCPLSKWGPNNTPPLCMQTYNYLSRFVDSEEESDIPISLSLSKSSAKTAKKINTRLRFLRDGVNIWDVALKLKTVKQTNDKGTFFVLDMVGIEQLGEDDASFGSDMYSFLKSTNYIIQHDTEPEAVEEDDGERPAF